MEEKEFYKKIMQRYLDKQLDDEELEVFIALTKAGKLDEQFTAAMDDEIRMMDAFSSPKQKTLSLWYPVAIAAGLLLVLSVGIFFFLSKSRQNTKDIAYSDIDPGSYKAVLTLANGHKIMLTDSIRGKLAEQAGIEITKTSEGQLQYLVKDKAADNPKALYNTITTPRGGKYQVNLPDGTKIWLNAASSLKFPTSFAGLKERRVELTGEAYFEVAKLGARSHMKTKKIPFIVVSDKQEVEVFGTHFNISTYDNEPDVKTTLLEGSVGVTVFNVIHQYELLKPGEQSVFKSGKLSVAPVDTEAEVAWKDGNFNFEEENIQSIMRKLERWYDIQVVYNGPVSEATFGGKISASRPLSKALKLLESAGIVHFKVEGRRITVMP